MIVKISGFMVAVYTNRIYSYLDLDNYSFLKELKAADKSITYSKIIRLAVIELRKNNSCNDIKQKLIKEMV